MDHADALCLVLAHDRRYLWRTHSGFNGRDLLEQTLKMFTPKVPHAVLSKEPLLEPFYGPTGLVEFYQLNGLTQDEMMAGSCWTSAGVVST